MAPNTLAGFSPHMEMGILCLSQFVPGERLGNHSEVTLEKKATEAGIEPTTSDYIHQCSKPLSYQVNKVVAYRYPTHPLMPLSIPL